MKLLTRDTSAFKFLTLGGLLSKHDFLETIEREVPADFQDARYRQALNGFGVDEENVRDFIISLLRSMRWESVVREHDVLAKFGEESLLVECKRHDSRLLYIDEHRGGSPGETAVEELQRNLKRTGVKWGLLTDGVTFRFIYNADLAPDLFDNYLEFSLRDMVDSTHRWPFEMSWLVDFLTPVSLMRRKDPTRLNALSKTHVNKILRVLRDEPRGLHTVIKSLAVAALEDMGVRPLHTGIQSIRSAMTKNEFLEIFSSIESDDPDFHNDTHFITGPLCTAIHEVLEALSEVDLSHIDHEFFGIVYQKFINNGNASHYTNSKLSREMANYIASRSEKTQMPNARAIYLEEDDYILDPALGSGQLLRGLLPFHRVFFRGNSSGIDGWRQLACHFMGRDIDRNAIWIAKINIWLATADKGEPLIGLPEFKELDVISAAIGRAAGRTIRQAFQIDPRYNVAACVSNPPWDAFKNDRRREINFDAEVVGQIRMSLNLNVRQLNRAQIFLRIIQRLGEECNNMRFSVILPDSIFVDTNDEIRDSLRANLDFYFSFPRNGDPITMRNRIFGDVDNTRKFGIIFGRSQTNFGSVLCYPYGGSTPIEVTEGLQRIGNHNALPLFSHEVQASVVHKWNQARHRNPRWREGEFHQSAWADREGRSESNQGRHPVVGGACFCNENSSWSRQPIDNTRVWKRMSRITPNDLVLSNSARTLFSDYLNKSLKYNSATYIPANSGINVTNKIVYSLETEPNDWLIYDSIVFSTLVEVYGTSQNMNAWRMSAVGLPRSLRSRTSIPANVELCQLIGLTLQEALTLYDLNSAWMSRTITRDAWQNQIASLPAAPQETENLRQRVQRARRRTRNTRRN